MPEISVIIPNYNHAAFLKERLATVYGQEYKDFEVILLDDASEDTSRELMEPYMDHPKTSRVLFNEENSGSVIGQWQKGIEESSGNWIWVAESDDYAATDFLKQASAYFDKEVGMVGCESIPVDVSGNLTDGHKNYFEDGLWQGGDIRMWLLENPVPNASGVVFKKECWTEFKHLVKDYRLNGDWLLWSLIANRHGMAHVGTELNFFRQHGQTVRKEHTSKGNNLVEYASLLNELVNQGVCDPKDVAPGLDYLYKLWISRKDVPLAHNLKIRKLGRRLEKKSGHKAGFSVSKALKLSYG